MKPKLIVIEGSDASGKKTQTELLVKRLKKEGYGVETFSFPNYPSETGKRIKRYLDRKLDLDVYEAAKLYAQDRLAVRDKLINWLKHGKIIVLDRYILSSKAHLSVKVKDNNFFNWIDEIEYEKSNMPKEDLVIFLYVPADISIKLSKKRDPEHAKTDIHESDKEYLKKVEKQYLELVKENKIDCVKDGKLLSKEYIHEKVWDIVRTKL